MSQSEQPEKNERDGGITEAEAVRKFFDNPNGPFEPEVRAVLERLFKRSDTEHPIDRLLREAEEEVAVARGQNVKGAARDYLACFAELNHVRPALDGYLDGLREVVCMGESDEKVRAVAIEKLAQRLVESFQYHEDTSITVEFLDRLAMFCREAREKAVQIGIEIEGQEFECP